MPPLLRNSTLLDDGATVSVLCAADEGVSADVLCIVVPRATGTANLGLEEHPAFGVHRISFFSEGAVAESPPVLCWCIVRTVDLAGSVDVLLWLRLYGFSHEKPKRRPEGIINMCKMRAGLRASRRPALSTQLSSQHGVLVLL